MKFILRHLSALIFLLLPFQMISSQDLELNRSKPDFNFNSTTVHKIFGHDENYYYVIKYHSNQFYIEKLDKQMNLIKSEPVKLHDKLKTFDLETIVHFYNEIIVFSSRRRFDDNTIYYHKIDKETLTSSTDFIRFAQIENIKGNWADFHFALSRNETKFLIACRIKLNFSKVQYNEYYVLGENMQLVWQKKDYLEFKGQGPRDNKYIVDDLGNVSILSLIKRSSIIDVFRDVKNIYTIYRYWANGEFYNEYPVTFPEKYIRGVRITGGDKGELVCAGLYSEILGYGVKGTFCFRIDPADGRVYDSHFHEFSADFLAELMQNKEPVISDDELISYVLSDLVFRKDGKIILIAEQVFAQPYDTYNNLIVSCFDTNGLLYWNRIIRKNQDFDIRYLTHSEIETGDYRDYILETGSIDVSIENYCSYALMAPIDRNEIVIFYNDNIKNLNKDAKKIFNFVNPRKSYIAAITIDEYGNMNKQTVYKWLKKDLYPEPIRYYHNLHDTIVIPAFKGRKFNYYTIRANF